MNDRDIWITANLMLMRFGEDAPIACAMRADELAAESDFAGVRVWRSISTAVEFLMEKKAAGPAQEAG